MVINGEFPGPTIEANEGDTIVVNVQNDLSTGTGIRTHRPASVMRFVNLYFFFSLIDWRTLFPAGTAGLILCLVSYLTIQTACIRMVPIGPTVFPAFLSALFLLVLRSLINLPSPISTVRTGIILTWVIPWRTASS